MGEVGRGQAFYGANFDGKGVGEMVPRQVKII